MLVDQIEQIKKEKVEIKKFIDYYAKYFRFSFVRRKEIKGKKWMKTKPANGGKELESYKSILRVIYTWAAFRDGELLVPKHVKDLIDKLNIKS